MTKLRLYSAKACPFAHRTRLVLQEKALDFGCLSGAEGRGTSC